MHKLLADFLSEPSNALFPFANEFVEQPSHYMSALEFRGETKVCSLWIGQPGNGKVTIAFPDGTMVNGNFKQFQMESGVIEFPTGVVVEGKFTKIDHCAIGLLQQGKVYLSDGKYLEVDCSGLMLARGRLMDASGQELIAFNGSPLVELEDRNSRSKLIFDTHTFAIEEFGRSNESALVQKTVYSYFGLYYCSVHAYEIEQLNCGALNGKTEILDSRLSTSINETEFRIDQSNVSANNVCLSIDGVDGVITLNVNDSKKPLYGYGFFANGVISLGLQVILLPNHKYFIVQNKLYSAAEFKQYIGLIEKADRKEINDDFINIPEQLNSPLSTAGGSDSFEFSSGSLKLLAETLLKNHALRQTLSQEKARSSHQLQRLGAIHHTMLQENEYLVSKVIQSSKTLADLHNELIKYSTIIQQKNHQISQLSSELLAGKDYANQLERVNHELKKVYNKKEKEFMALLKEVQQTPTNESHELRTVRHHNLVLNQENRILIDLKASTDSNIRDLEKRNLFLESELQRLERENKDMGAEAKAFTAEKQELLGHFDLLSNLSGDLKIRLNQMEILSHEKDRMIESQGKRIIQCAKQLEKIKAKVQREVVLEFKGQMIKGAKQGLCYLRTPEFEYEGEFKDDKFCGKGRLLFASNEKKLEGVFDEQGHFTGNVMQIGKTNYQGSIVNNQMAGKGALVFANNFIVEGVFKNDDFDSSQSYQITNLNDGTEDSVYVHPKRARCLISLENVCYEVEFVAGQLKPSQ